MSKSTSGPTRCVRATHAVAGSRPRHVSRSGAANAIGFGPKACEFYRGEGTVLHVCALPDEALRQLRVIPDRTAGPLTILRTPGTIAYEGTAARLAHPLLVYTEMMASTDPRAREAAAEIHERFLETKP